MPMGWQGNARAKGSKSVCGGGGMLESPALYQSRCAKGLGREENALNK